MAPQTKRLIGNIILAAAIIIVLINLAGMFRWMPKIWSVRDMNLVAIMMIILARVLRGRRGQTSPPPVNPG